MGLKNLTNKLKLAAHLKDPRMRSLTWWVELFHKAEGVKEARDMLKGKKTYIVAALAAAVVVGHTLGVVDSDLANRLLELLGVGAVITLRAGMNNAASQ